LLLQFNSQLAFSFPWRNILAPWSAVATLPQPPSGLVSLPWRPVKNNKLTTVNYEPWIFVIWTHTPMSTSGENLFSSHYNLSVVRAAWFYLSQGAQFSYSHRRFAASSIAPPTRYSAFLQRYKYVIIQYSTMWEMREYFRIVKLMDGKSHTYGCNIMPAEHISAWATSNILWQKATVEESNITWFRQ
jgi:hypothetical protein